MTFIKKADYTPRIYGNIRSLTLRLNTLWPTNGECSTGRAEDSVAWKQGLNPRTWKLCTDLETLAHRIDSSMKNLTSFSLRIDKFPPAGRAEGHRNDPLGARMKTRTLRCLLEALPKSCIDVELDTRGRDDDRVCYFNPDYNDHVHLCPTIRNLLPRLQHVRLRLGSLCSDLIF